MGAAKYLTAESLEKLLHLLSADETAANIAYQKLRDSLSRYFLLKGDAIPDEAADLTLDRVVNKIEEGIKIEDITKYSFGVARFIFLERFRLAEKISDAEQIFHEKNISENDSRDADDFALMRECFKALPEKDRKILIDYFADLNFDDLTGRRQLLIDDLGGSLNKLRLKIFRLRKTLKNCVRGKLGK